MLLTYQAVVMTDDAILDVQGPQGVFIHGPAVTEDALFISSLILDCFQT